MTPLDLFKSCWWWGKRGRLQEVDFCHVSAIEREEIDAWLLRIVPEPLDERVLDRILQKACVSRVGCGHERSGSFVPSSSRVARCPVDSNRKLISKRPALVFSRGGAPRHKENTWQQGLVCACVAIVSVLSLSLPPGFSHCDRNGQSQASALGRYHW
jgi:hypothetical protein